MHWTDLKMTWDGSSLRFGHPRALRELKVQTRVWCILPCLALERLNRSHCLWGEWQESRILIRSTVYCLLNIHKLPRVFDQGGWSELAQHPLRDYPNVTGREWPRLQHRSLQGRVQHEGGMGFLELVFYAKHSLFQPPLPSPPSSKIYLSVASYTNWSQIVTVPNLWL